MKKYDCLNTLIGTKSVCIIGHVNADPDALSSMVVLKDILKSVFKISKIDLFSDSPVIGDNLLEILGSNKLYTNLSEIRVKKYEVCVVLDSPNLDRLGCFKFLYNNATKTINIDHHATNLAIAQTNIIENSSSCCEIVYNIAKHFKYSLSTEQKGKLYAGIITDTNNFTVGNFDDKTFKICSDITKNIDKKAIYNAFLSNNTLKTMQLLSLAINNIASFNHNQIIISHISHEEAKQQKATHEDLCKIINQLATINTAKLTCFIEPRDNHYYVSMRAKESFDVAKIAKVHGGGGHIGAAAFLSNLSLKETEQLILTEFREQLSSVKPKFKRIFN